MYTPELWTILPWITRATIIEIVKEEFWIDTIEWKIKPEDLGKYSEAFFVWTAAEVTPIWSIGYNWNKYDFNSFEKNSLSNKIKDYYLSIVTWEVEKYNNWLS